MLGLQNSFSLLLGSMVEDELYGNATDEETPGQQNGSDGGSNDDDDNHSRKYRPIPIRIGRYVSVSAESDPIPCRYLRILCFSSNFCHFDPILVIIRLKTWTRDWLNRV